MRHTQDITGNELHPGDIVYYIHPDTGYKPTHLCLGIIDYTDGDIAYIIDPTQTYQYRKTSEQLILHTSEHRGQNLGFIAALYNTEKPATL